MSYSLQIQFELSTPVKLYNVIFGLNTGERSLYTETTEILLLDLKGVGKQFRFKF